MNTNQFYKRIMLALVALAALCLASSLASAQSFDGACNGKFTLPFEARWGQVVLPPGTYTFTLNSASKSLPYLITLRGEKIFTSRNETKAVFILPGQPPSVSDHPGGPNELTAVRFGKTWRIQSLKLGSVGLALSYPIPKKERETMAREVWKTLPIAMSANGQ